MLQVCVPFPLDHRPSPVIRQGLSQFRGKLVHARDFEDVSIVRGKHVLIVGAGGCKCGGSVREVWASTASRWFEF